MTETEGTATGRKERTKIERTEMERTETERTENNITKYIRMILTLAKV